MPSIAERIFALEPHDLARYDGIAEQFENAWLSYPRAPPTIDGELPAEEPLRLLVLVHLVKCDLEARLFAGEAVRAEAYFARFPEFAQDASAQLEVICWEHQLRGEGTDLAEYERRFPDLASDLRRRLGAATAPPPWHPPAGYTLGRVFPRGGMGLVFLVEDQKLPRQVVIKE